VTILFSALAIIGVIETISLVVISVVLGRSDRDSDRDVVSFRLMSQAAAVLGAGLGGLAMTVGHAGALGFFVVAVATWILVMVLMWMVVLPFTRRRQPNRQRRD
jgi:hypothetical protein